MSFRLQGEISLIEVTHNLKISQSLIKSLIRNDKQKRHYEGAYDRSNLFVTNSKHKDYFVTTRNDTFRHSSQREGKHLLSSRTGV